jgi:hypothetical protein
MTQANAIADALSMEILLRKRASALRGLIFCESAKCASVLMNYIECGIGNPPALRALA